VNNRRTWIIAGLAILGGGPVAADEIYFGNLHAHTSYSDGSGAPREAFSMAKSAGLDFFAVTEHNHKDAEMGATPDRRDNKLIATQPALYQGADAASLKSAAAKASKDGQFIALYGQEFSTISSGNHVNVFDAASVIDAKSGDFADLLDWLKRHPDSAGAIPVVQFNHPRGGQRFETDYGRVKLGPDENWVATLGPAVSLIEVLNAPAMEEGGLHRAESKERQYLAYLNVGFRIGPSVGHDNHYKTWGTISHARVGVYAASLTKPAILSALRARRTFASEDKNLKVIFRSSGWVMGDVAPAPATDTEYDLSLDLHDPDEPNAAYRIDVFQDMPGGDPAFRPVQSYRVQGNGVWTLDGVYARQAGEYVLVRVTQSSGPDAEHEDEDRAWSAPIWFDGAAAPLTPPSLATPALRLVSLLPDPEGPDLQNEQITVANTTDAPLSLAGWQLRDLSGAYWTFDTSIVLAARAEQTLTRAGQPLSLNNGGDTVELLDAKGMVVQTFTYPKVQVNQVVTTDGPA